MVVVVVVVVLVMVVVAAAAATVAVAKAIVGLVGMKIIHPKLFINPSLHSAELRII